MCSSDLAFYLTWQHLVEASAFIYIYIYIDFHSSINVIIHNFFYHFLSLTNQTKEIFSFLFSLFLTLCLVWRKRMKEKRKWFKRKEKMWTNVIARFFNKFCSFLFLLFYPNSGNNLISFPFKPNKVLVSYYIWEKYFIFSFFVISFLFP